MELSKIQKKKYRSIEDDVGLIRSEDVFLKYSARQMSKSFSAATIEDEDDVNLIIASQKLAESVAGILAYYEYEGTNSGDLIASNLADIDCSSAEDRAPDQLFLSASMALMSVYGAFYEKENIDTIVETYIAAVKGLMENTNLNSLEESMREVEEKW